MDILMSWFWVNILMSWSWMDILVSWCWVDILGWLVSNIMGWGFIWDSLVTIINNSGVALVDWWSWWLNNLWGLADSSMCWSNDVLFWVSMCVMLWGWDNSVSWLVMVGKSWGIMMFVVFWIVISSYWSWLMGNVCLWFWVWDSLGVWRMFWVSTISGNSRSGDDASLSNSKCSAENNKLLKDKKNC